VTSKSLAFTKHFRRLLMVLSVAACVVSGLAFAADQPSAHQPRAAQPPAAGQSSQPASGQSPEILPREFGGWQRQSNGKLSKDPAVADAANAAVLKEFGFNSFESANYIRDDGRKLALRAARFEDASGAYGAFTFYKQPEMLNEKIGDQGSSLNNRVLFYRGNTLIDAVFDRLSVMSAAELRELANALQLPSGAALNLPSLPAYLPRQSYVKNTAKYVMGPVGMQRVGGPIPAQLIEFANGAEVAMAKYTASGGDAWLTLVSYPTPQIAADRLRKIDEAKPQTSSPAGATSLLADAGAVFDKRTGPIVVIASGALSESEAKSLLASVNYDANVTWNENTSTHEQKDLFNLLINILILSAVLSGIALVGGVAFGGVRIIMRRFYPERGLGRGEELEFISLHLSEPEKEPPGETRSSPAGT
jgi:hypothetical protein